MSDFTHIDYSVKNRVATIMIDRAEAMNSITPELEAELHAALDVADADPEVQVAILTGAGTTAFSAGYDIGSEGPDGRPMDPTNKAVGDYIKFWWNSDRAAADKLMHIWKLDIPVIAAVNGWALGGGFWYQLACDITIAADNAVFGQPEVRHISNTTFLFAALAGWKAANRYGLTGDHFDAQEAYRLGIVNEVVPADELMDTTRALAERIAMVPAAAIRLNKAITMMGLESAGVGSGMKLNAVLSAIAHSSHGPEREELFDQQRKDGIRGFLKARDDKFRPEPFGPRSR
ncbi:enoyl-CoA hydratase/isomerase family protein [Aeromicrobium sp. YIM 150415]|uniref:enoyl-CoA hydratase/isomerase family protein n=1 Tax=Aeromicrobium sp. YIM 150415 TaxID=2803912 RepID=UPI0019625AA8|nr:enoyl-CoA hydratase/isomerase family protein [Aeromicrobium sp. YIM 150415]MBM9463230.1 enoyl-CoA hydratase/isomerase family protein [Aeromicrobium sp. YIM 150415]